MAAKITNIPALIAAIAATGCPTVAVVVGDGPGDTLGNYIQFDPKATDTQKSAAQAVLDGWVDPPPDLRAYAASAMQAKLAAGETFNVAASGQPAVEILCDGTNDTRADLGLLALFGQANPTSTKMWVDDDGVVTSLTGAQLVTLATLAGNWISDCYPALAGILAGIASGAITTTAQIDETFAAVTK